MIKVTRQLKALKVIEHLTCNDDFSDNKLLGAIYIFSHIAVASCQNEHKDWVAQLDKAYDALFRS